MKENIMPMPSAATEIKAASLPGCLAKDSKAKCSNSKAV
jgi:hypothetical protein